MDNLLHQIKSLVASGKVRISEHGYDELSEDELATREVISGVPDAITVEQYPDYPKGPCVLVLQRGREGAPIHVVWGIPKGCDEPAVLVTAYRPDPKRWDDDYIRRR